jgi:hypothetical protein
LIACTILVRSIFVSGACGTMALPIFDDGMLSADFNTLQMHCWCRHPPAEEHDKRRFLRNPHFRRKKWHCLPPTY